MGNEPTPTVETTGQLPQSTALAEADPFSLTELMSRDPESYNAQDRGRIVAALRADRARRENAEKLAAEIGRKRGPTAQKVEAIVPISADKLGL